MTESAGGNPYEAPKSHVEDSGTPPAAATMPVIVQHALLILAATVTLEILGDVVSCRAIVDVARSAPQYLACFALTFVASVILIFKISQRRNWARIAYLLLVSFVVLFFGVAVARNAQTRASFSRGAVVQMVLQIVALILLFLPRANAWFRRT